jgi:tetratricopeptide repeat protein 30
MSLLMIAEVHSKTNLLCLKSSSSFSFPGKTRKHTGEFKQAIAFLSEKQVLNPNSRAALSLLAYCYYYSQEFSSAANTYEQLVSLFPDVDDYRINYASSLYQACLYEEAMRVSFEMEPPLAGRRKADLIKLRAAIRYSEEDMPSSRKFTQELTDESDRVDREVNLACVSFKEGNVDQALSAFTECSRIEHNKRDLMYNRALCCFTLKDHEAAMKILSEIIEKGIRDHPELNVGLTTDGIDVRSVGNTITLHETALVEAFNLKAGIEYMSGNFEAAMEALTDMPPRSEEELDPVTLHNQALMTMDSNPGEGFEKLQFLIQQPSFPPETFANLLILYCKYEYFDLAADVMAENADLTYKLLSPYLYDFLDALITQQTSPEDAFRKFDEMGSKYTNEMRKLMKQMQEIKSNPGTQTFAGAAAALVVASTSAAASSSSTAAASAAGTATTASLPEVVRKITSQQEDLLSLYMPVLMSQAKIYWDLEMYAHVEKVFRKSVEFCSEHDIWKLNVAHVLFMQV